MYPGIREDARLDPGWGEIGLSYFNGDRRDGDDGAMPLSIKALSLEIGFGKISFYRALACWLWGSLLGMW